MRTIFAPGILLAAALITIVAALSPAFAQGHAAPAYVGSQVCVGCHAAAGKGWTGSDHALAWTLPDEATVLGNFDDAMIVHKGVTTRFSRRDDAFLVETQGPEGLQTEYEVRGVAGIAPLQQYLLETEPGRLQALDIAWDVEGQRWYDLYPDQDLPYSDGLHWTGPYKNWNARCAECHATGFEKNYDAATHRYESHQAEIGVGCEACHGPGEAHASWAKAPDTYDAIRWPGLTEKGFTIGFSASVPETEIQQCAGCHSRRGPFGNGNPLPGTPFHDAYRLSLLRPGLYHADGSIQDEVYVYGSFLQSRMYANGVRCTDCHDPHAANLKAEGNAVCTQCHSAAGNERFPTLRKATYDDPAHHFHEPGTDGAACKSCHMVERVYMGIDGRRDHSFRVPRPDLSMVTDSPNACNDCHANRNAAWAAAEIEKRFPNSYRRGPHFAETFFAARSDPTSMTQSLLGIAEYEDLPAIIRASALELLLSVSDAGIATRTEPLLQDANPLVREAAISLQRGAPQTEQIPRLTALLEDPVRSVRIAAARGFIGAKIAHFPTQIDLALRAATAEMHASLLVNADFPEAQLAIGGGALAVRDVKAAEGAFREAVRLDPQRVDAWTMIIRILAATGDISGARHAADKALAANPSDATLKSFRDQLGVTKDP